MTFRPADVNFLTHVSWVQSRVEGMRVDRDEQLAVVDSGLPCDTFNFICAARLRTETLRARVEQAIGHFREVGRPFSWWVGPADSPADLGAALEAAGLAASEAELGMKCNLERLVEADPPPELRIERVSTPQALATFAALSAANWDPPDQAVVRFYQLAETVLLEPVCPLRFYLGYWSDEPVATAEMTVAGGAAGLYNISTRAAFRRRGIGTAMVIHPLLEARASGCREGILQAAPDGVGVYRQVGFCEDGQYVEYKP